MKTRARRLAEILERDYDYVVYDTKKRGPKCDERNYYSDAKFCHKCGTKLIRNKLWREGPEANLENALKDAGI